MINRKGPLTLPPALFFQGIHLFDITLNITFALQPGCGHIADFTENRPLEPGPVVNAEDPGHTGVGVGIAAVEKKFVIDGQGCFKSLFRLRRPFQNPVEVISRMAAFQ